LIFELDQSNMNALAIKLQRHMQQNPLKGNSGDYDFRERGKELLIEVRALTPKKCSNKIRLQCAQFIIMHYTLEAMQLGRTSQDAPMAVPDAELLENFRAAQAKDMDLAWKLLSARAFNSTDLAKAAGVLKIDISQRLEDPIKLSETFKDFTRKQLETQDVMVAITAAPFLADWKAARNLIKRAERLVGRKILDTQWHTMSQNMPIPDYSVLFKLADENKLEQRPTPNPKDLTWETIQVAKIRVKFSHVDCGPFTNKAAELLAEIQNSPIEWEEVPAGPNVQIKKMGGFFQTVSFGDMPMSLCGPHVEDGKLRVIGSIELVVQDPSTMAGAQRGGMIDPSQIDPSKVVVQREEWNLEKVPNCEPPVWKGKYLLDQGPMKLDVNNPDTAPVNMRFELEIYEKGPEGNCHPVLGGEEEKVTIAGGPEKEEDKDQIKAGTLIEKDPTKKVEIEGEVEHKGNAVPKTEKVNRVIEKVITEIDDLEMD